MTLHQHQQSISSKVHVDDYIPIQIQPTGTLLLAAASDDSNRDETISKALHLPMTQT
jgi:hypothetical protein